MSEFFTGEPPTSEHEGSLETPEQAEPPRVRNEARKIILPADADLKRLVHDSSPEILTAVAADPRLTEDLALALLNHRDLSREALEALSKNGQLSRLRKVRMAMVMHPRTPRHVSVPTIRHLHTFELMQVALFAGGPARREARGGRGPDQQAGQYFFRENALPLLYGVQAEWRQRYYWIRKSAS